MQNKSFSILIQCLVLSFSVGFLITIVHAGPSPTKGLPAAQEHVLEVLKKLIEIDTTNPPGGETAAAQYLKNFFDEAGIDSKIIESAPGRGSLIARIKGDGSKRPILLVSHLDVVGVEKEHWSTDPFKAVEKNGRLYGRGSSDIKDLAAIQLEAMLLIKHLNQKLHRDIIYASVADEESGGELGMKYLIENHWPEIEAEFAFNEGSRGKPYLKDGKIRWASLQVTERRSMNIRMIARGTSAHSMLPMPDNALYTLGRALDKISRYKPPIHLNTAIKAYFDGIAKLEHKPKDWYLKASVGNTEEARGLYAMTHTTLNPTIMKAGFRSNVIPADAEVIINCRLLPDTSAEEIIADLTKAVNDPKIKFEIERAPLPPAPISKLDSVAVKAYTKVIQNNFGSNVPFIPTVGAGSTDSKYLRAKGVDSYALEPYDDQPQNGHGNDESISIDGLKNSVKIYFELLQELAI